MKHVFENVASNYDLMNDLMSGGVHRVWKDTLVDMLGVSKISQRDLQVLDVAGGTGDIAFRISRAMKEARQGEPAPADEFDDAESRIVISDINDAMLEEGRRRAAELPELSAPGAPRLEWVTADARKLPFDDCSFDLYSIAFGIRNVTVIPEALAERAACCDRAAASSASNSARWLAPATLGRSTASHLFARGPSAHSAAAGDQPGAALAVRPYSLPSCRRLVSLSPTTARRISTWSRASASSQTRRRLPR